MYVPCSIWDTLILKFCCFLIFKFHHVSYILYDNPTPLPPEVEALRAFDLHASSALCRVILPSTSVPVPRGLPLPPGCRYHPWARGTHIVPAESEWVSCGTTAHQPTQSHFFWLRLWDQPLVSCAQTCSSQPSCFLEWPGLPGLCNTSPLWPVGLLSHITQLHP